MRNLTLRLANGSLVAEYRAIDGHPVSHQVTIQRRTLTPSGDKYRASEWKTMTAGDVRTHVRLNSPVARWLRAETGVDLREGRIAAYADDAPAHLFCQIPTRDASDNIAARVPRRRISSRA
jgi:hypothetical protein